MTPSIATLFDNREDKRKRRIYFLINGMLSILLCTMGAIFGFITTPYIRIPLAIFSFIFLFSSVGFYGKETNMYKAIIYCFFIVFLMFLLIGFFTMGVNWINYLFLLIIVGCIWLGNKGLTYIWNSTGGS